jgi:cobalt-zinc-cadmium efflux system outer membrane protein
LVDAGQLPNPVLSLLLPLGPKQLEATLPQSLIFLWQRPGRVAAAHLDAERIADNLVHNGLTLIRDTRIAHADLVAAERAASLAQNKSELLQEIASISEARLRAGDISDLTVSAIRLEALQATQTAIQSQHAATAARQRLLGLLGSGQTDLRFQPLAPTLGQHMPTDENALLTTAFAARPDLRAAELAVEAAGQRLGLERAKIFGLAGIFDANAKGSKGFEAGPGLQIELPVLSQNNAGRVRAQAELDRALRQYVAKQQEIMLAVQQARASYVAAAQTLTFWQAEVLPAVQKAVLQTESALQAGEVSYLAVLDQKRQLVEAQLHEVSALSALTTAAAQLHYSIGTRGKF